ncbi:MAG: hypothetical protein GTN93_32955 [Anaerolineae bacterium]|nr:hypothetical protein [Anaerolineae bacterium]
MNGNVYKWVLGGVLVVLGAIVGYIGEQVVEATSKMIAIESRVERLEKNGNDRYTGTEASTDKARYDAKLQRLDDALDVVEVNQGGLSVHQELAKLRERVRLLEAQIGKQQ